MRVFSVKVSLGFDKKLSVDCSFAKRAPNLLVGPHISTFLLVAGHNALSRRKAGTFDLGKTASSSAARASSLSGVQVNAECKLRCFRTCDRLTTFDRFVANSVIELLASSTNRPVLSTPSELKWYIAPTIRVLLLPRCDVTRTTSSTNRSLFAKWRSATVPRTIAPCNASGMR